MPLASYYNLKKQVTGEGRICALKQNNAVSNLIPELLKLFKFLKIRAFKAQLEKKTLEPNTKEQSLHRFFK